MGLKEYCIHLKGIHWSRSLTVRQEVTVCTCVASLYLKLNTGAPVFAGAVMELDAD